MDKKHTARNRIKLLIGFVLVVCVNLGVVLVARKKTTSPLRNYPLGLSSLPLASVTSYATDLPVVLTPAPLPNPCRLENGIVYFCLDPFELSMPEARYEILKKQWGIRRAAPARFTGLWQSAAHEWTLELQSESEVEPLVWFDSSAEGSVLLWPVSVAISRIQISSLASVPKVEPLGKNLLRIQFPQDSAGRLRRWTAVWKNKTDLSIGWSTASGPFRVLVDAGHGGDERGTQHLGFEEASLNLRAANHLKSALSALGVTVESMREAETTVPIYTRFQRVDRGEADLAISIHHDFSPVFEKRARPACLFSRADVLPLAWDLCRVINKVSGIAVDPARWPLMVNCSARTPSLLLELLNLRDPRDGAIVTDSKKYESFLNQWAKETALEIMKHLKLSRLN